MTERVALPPAALPKSETKQISAKREFEKIILEICRKFAESRTIAGEQAELLIQASQKDSDWQWYLQLGGNLGQACISLLGAGLTAKTSKPEQFQMYSKIGDIFKGVLDVNQYSHTMNKEKIQHANGQWSAFANGTQDAIRNLKAAQQRLQQMEDNTNR